MKERNSRRAALQKLVASVPVAWSTPVVQAICLPAHAQTTVTEPPEDIPPCATTDRVAARSLGCTGLGSCTVYSYQLQEGCLVRTTRSCQGLLGSNEFSIEFSNNVGPELLTIEIQSFFGLYTFFTQMCNAPFPDGLLQGLPLPLLVDSVPYEASMVVGITESPATVYHGEILVAPA